MEFNEKLQELRKQRGITQEELAQSLFVSRTAISKWESGRGYPNMESLKAISKYFSVSLDELLSTDEVLSIAQEDRKQAQTHLRDLVYGLLDLSMLLLFFLPLFAQRADDAVSALSLLHISTGQLWLRIAYFVVVIANVVMGVLILTLQNCRARRWLDLKEKLSLSCGALALLLFVISLQPYAAVFVLVLLTVKVVLMIKPL